MSPGPLTTVSAPSPVGAPAATARPVIGTPSPSSASTTGETDTEPPLPAIRASASSV